MTDKVLDFYVCEQDIATEDKGLSRITTKVTTLEISNN